MVKLRTSSTNILIHVSQYNDGIPGDTRFAMHSKFFKGTVDSLQNEEGLTKIRKVKELSALAEQGESIGNSVCSSS